MKDYNARMMAPVTVTARDSWRRRQDTIEIWDGSKWVPQTDWISAFKDDVWSVVKAQSADYASRGGEIIGAKPMNPAPAVRDSFQ